MNNFVDRGSHLSPALPEAWYAIPLRLMIGYGLRDGPALPRRLGRVGIGRVGTLRA